MQVDNKADGSAVFASTFRLLLSGQLSTSWRCCTIDGRDLWPHFLTLSSPAQKPRLQMRSRWDWPYFCCPVPEIASLCMLG